MKTTNEQRVSALRVIDKILILQYNVKNGCASDREELEKQEARLAGIKAWAIANDELVSIKHYFASNNFGYELQFLAADLATYFY